MRAVLLNKTGKPSVLTVSEIPDPQVKPGEVLVQLETSGINYAEILSRKGLYGWAPKRPYILGMEGAGVIAAVGPGVSKSRIGQRVMIGTQFGCYAEKIAIPENRALPVPADFSMQEAAAFAVNYLTAWVALTEIGRMQPRENVLITAAAGGVGTAAVQMAVARGCRVFAMAGSEAKLQMLREMSVTAALNYREPNVFDQLRELSKGIDVVLEVVGGEVYRYSLALLNPFGRMVVVGFASLDFRWWNPLSWWRTLRDIPRAKIMNLAEQSVSVSASHLGYLLQNEKVMRASFDRLTDFVSRHNIRPVVGAEYPLAQVAEAQAFIESRQSVGKVLLKIKD